MATYIYQYPDWPDFTWNQPAIALLCSEVRHLQGKITGSMSMLGFSGRQEAVLSALTTDVVKSSEIEGEKLDIEQVRSSIASRLGINTAGLPAPDRHAEGMVDMLLDATRNHNEELSHERLFAWHAALFPTAYSGMHKIETGKYRSGEMLIVSGAMGREKIHYEAPAAMRVKQEMNLFLDWFNGNSKLDPVLKAAIAHFWFIIIHPFDDGNGRIARAISDLLLARADGMADRFYSMSGQMMLERKEYYAVLQKVQHSSRDISEWLEWFLHCLRAALLSTQSAMEKVMLKSRFWELHEDTRFNPRQRLVINRLLDGFEGRLKTSKWARLAKCSSDTALRDIRDLMEKGILQQDNPGGRSTGYLLGPF